MGEFKVKMKAINPTERNRATPPVEALVDTGSLWSWLPRQLLLDAGIKPEGKKRMMTITKQPIEREFGYAILQAESRATAGEVIFAEDGDMSVLGVITIEGFCVMVDNVGQCFIDRQYAFAPTAVPGE